MIVPVLPRRPPELPGTRAVDAGPAGHHGPAGVFLALLCCGMSSAAINSSILSVSVSAHSTRNRNVLVPGCSACLQFGRRTASIWGICGS